MDVRIGVIYTGKELEVELPDDTDREALSKTIDAAVSGTTPVLWLTDRKGKTVGVPAERIAYVELGRSTSDRKVGFAG
ncbi:MAG TPA: DUF3107 domain-containing protein [Acidimicrobiales bacterium]|nr:DUF3107 domain-containing protein [Acidimicrobiales bacterium]